MYFKVMKTAHKAEFKKRKINMKKQLLALELVNIFNGRKKKQFELNDQLAFP